MKNGFTLIELIVAVLVLSIISVIAIPKINDVINSSKTSLYNQNIKTITDAAKTYVVENMHDYKDQNEFTISLSLLCDEHLITCPIVDPITEENMDGEVKVTVVDEKFNYEYIK